MENKQKISDVMQQFQDREEKYDIIEEIKKIQQEKKIYKYEEIKLMHSDFSEQNPELFERCIREDMTTDNNMKHMKFLLEQRNKVKNKEIQFDKASGYISLCMAKEFQPELLQKDGFSKKKK